MYQQAGGTPAPFFPTTRNQSNDAWILARAKNQVYNDLMWQRAITTDLTMK